MPPELSIDDYVMRVDGDMVEFFVRGDTKPNKIPLKWLVVQAQPSRARRAGQMQTYYLLQVNSADVGDRPLYSVTNNPTSLLDPFWISISVEEEPAFRAFFAELAALCGRSVEGPPGT
jgi:hypothetical protein